MYIYMWTIKKIPVQRSGLADFPGPQHRSVFTEARDMIQMKRCLPRIWDQIRTAVLKAGGVCLQSPRWGSKDKRMPDNLLVCQSRRISEFQVHWEILPESHQTWTSGLHMYTYTHVHTRAHTYTYTCIYIYTCTCIHMYIHLHIYTCVRFTFS